MHLHRNPSALLLVLAALLTTGLAAHAQQDGDVTVIIKAKSKPATLPTLLVMCDLVCNWKLDGEVKGHIYAGGSVKVKVEPGQHMVEATTEDGVDWVKQPSTVKPTGQTMVNIELQSRKHRTRLRRRLRGKLRPRQRLSNCSKRPRRQHGTRRPARRYLASGQTLQRA
jgi:hypothetical protein